MHIIFAFTQKSIHGGIKMKERLEKIEQDYKNGHMSIEDIGWLLIELKATNEKIEQLEKKQ
jgi:hypothetical protein